MFGLHLHGWQLPARDFCFLLGGPNRPSSNWKRLHFINFASFVVGQLFFLGQEVKYCPSLVWGFGIKHRALTVEWSEMFHILRLKICVINFSLIYWPMLSNTTNNSDFLSTFCVRKKLSKHFNEYFMKLERIRYFEALSSLWRKGKQFFDRKLPVLQFNQNYDRVSIMNLKNVNVALC